MGRRLPPTASVRSVLTACRCSAVSVKRSSTASMYSSSPNGVAAEPSEEEGGAHERSSARASSGSVCSSRSMPASRASTCALRSAITRVRFAFANAVLAVYSRSRRSS